MLTRAERVGAHGGIDCPIHRMPWLMRILRGGCYLENLTQNEVKIGQLGIWRTGFRKDGWPLCPFCGDDELWSSLNWDGQGDRPPVQAYIDAGLTCYACGPVLPPKPARAEHDRHAGSH